MPLNSRLESNTEEHEGSRGGHVAVDDRGKWRAEGVRETVGEALPADEASEREDA